MLLLPARRPAGGPHRHRARPDLRPADRSWHRRRGTTGRRSASGLVNAAHQLCGALGLGILVVIAAAGATGASAEEQLASVVTAALTGGAVMLALAVALVLVLIVHRRSVAEAADRHHVARTTR